MIVMSLKCSQTPIKIWRLQLLVDWVFLERLLQLVGWSLIKMRAFRRSLIAWVAGTWLETTKVINNLTFYPMGTMRLFAFECRGHEGGTQIGLNERLHKYYVWGWLCRYVEGTWRRGMRKISHWIVFIHQIQRQCTFVTDLLACWGVHPLLC